MALRMGRTYYTTRQVRAEDLMVNDIVLFTDGWARIIESPDRTTVDHLVRVIYCSDRQGCGPRDRLCQEYELVTVQVELTAA